MEEYIDCLNVSPHKCTHLAYALLPFARYEPKHTFLAFVDVALDNPQLLMYFFVFSQLVTLIFVLPLWGVLWIVGKKVARVVWTYPIAVTVMLFAFVVGLNNPF